MSDKTENKSPVIKSNTSKELLLITGDGSQKAVIKSLIKKKKQQPRKLETFKVTRSPLFDQLQDFLPKIKKSTNELMKKTDEEKEELDVENVEGCNNIVEMNLLLGQMGDENSSSSDDDDDDPKEVVTPSTLKIPQTLSSPRANGKKSKCLISEIEGEGEAMEQS